MLVVLDDGANGKSPGHDGHRSRALHIVQAVLLPDDRRYIGFQGHCVRDPECTARRTGNRDRSRIPAHRRLATRDDSDIDRAACLGLHVQFILVDVQTPYRDPQVERAGHDCHRVTRGHDRNRILVAVGVQRQVLLHRDERCRRDGAVIEQADGNCVRYTLTDCSRNGQRQNRQHDNGAAWHGIGLLGVARTARWV